MPPPARRRHLSPWVSPVSPCAPHTVPSIRPSPLQPTRTSETTTKVPTLNVVAPHPTTPPPQVGSPPHGPNPTDARLATHGQTREEYELDPNHYERAGVRGERHKLHIDDQDSEDDDTNSGSDTRSVFNDPAGFYPEEPAARKAYGRLLAHRQDAEERARRHDEQHPPGVQGQVQARRRVAPDRGDDSTAIVPGRTVAETALADARVKSRKANVAEIAAFVRTAGGTAGVGGVAADALYGQTNRNDLCHLRGTLRRQDGIWVTFTKIQSHIEDAVADAGTIRCPHMVGVDRYAWKRSPHIAISERITGYKQFGKFILFYRMGNVNDVVFCVQAPTEAGPCRVRFTAPSAGKRWR